MIDASSSRKIHKWVTPAIGFILVLTMLLASFSIGYSQPANQESTNWSPPVNISQTGGATDPTVIMDSAGRIHVVWWDKFNGFMYAGGDGKQWSRARAVSFPFSPLKIEPNIPGHPKPTYIADLNGRVHVFWIDNQTLYYSNVHGSVFGTRGAWYAGKVLAESVLAVDVAMDSVGNLHLGFVRTAGSFLFAPGIYYRRLPSGSFAWEDAILIDESPYLRIIAPEEANIHIAVGQVDKRDRIYLVWDVPPRNRVFAAQYDGAVGKWSEPIEVDGPSGTSGPISARNIQVNAVGANVLRMWQIGQQGAGCAQYYEQSNDGGETWTQRRRFLAELQGCPQDTQFMVTKDGLVLTLVTVNDRIYLMAWDGQKWSVPQLQSSLASFVDPDTLNLLDFRYGRALLGPDNQIYIVGYDLTGNGDIWLSSRALGAVDRWFPTQASWSPPFQLAKSQAFFSSSALVPDGDSRFHAVWSEKSSLESGGAQGIYYSRWNGNNWSPPVAVINFALGTADNLSAAVDSKGKLLVVWNDQLSGKILFSSVDVAQAVNPEQWSEPKVLPSPSNNTAQSPHILVGSSGKVFVVYAVPINEGRGLYLTSSNDEGDTWTDARLIFDAAAAEWSMVDRPSLALGAADELFLLFTQYTIAGATVPVALNYMRSLDGGMNWSEPEVVDEGAASWSQIIAENETMVHRIWQTSDGGSYTLWHEISYDGGQSWKERKPFESLSGKYEPAYLSKDAAGRIHLFQLKQDTGGGSMLDQWLWGDRVWTKVDQLELPLGSQAIITDLRVAGGFTGDIGVLYRAITLDTELQKQQEILYVTERKLDLQGEAQSTVAEVATPETSPQITATAEPIATPTTALAYPKEAVQVSTVSSWTGLIVGVIVAAITIIAVIVVGARILGR